MQIDRSAFFAAVRARPFGGALTQGQVDGLNTILGRTPDEMPIEQLAYCLATVFHETARTMQPIEEYGRGRGHPYGVPDPATGKTYYGRGFVQLTWKANYDHLGRVVMADLVNHPELALRPDLAASIMFEGMRRGLFTGKKLADYFGAQNNPIGARRIINGLDCAEKIAGYHDAFLAALQGAVKAVPAPVVAAAPAPVRPRPLTSVNTAAPAPQPAPSAGFFARFLAGFRSASKTGA